MGFIALAHRYSDAMAAGELIAPAKSVEQMQHIIFNAWTNATLTALFLLVVYSILFYAVKVGIAGWRNPQRSDRETPFQPIPATTT